MAREEELRMGSHRHTDTYAHGALGRVLGLSFRVEWADKQVRGEIRYHKCSMLSPWRHIPGCGGENGSVTYQLHAGSCAVLGNLAPPGAVFPGTDKL